MKFEIPVVEVKKFDLEDVLTVSGNTEPNIKDDILTEVCTGTMSDYLEDNCPAY